MCVAQCLSCFSHGLLNINYWFTLLVTYVWCTVKPVLCIWPNLFWLASQIFPSYRISIIQQSIPCLITDFVFIGHICDCKNHRALQVTHTGAFMWINNLWMQMSVKCIANKHTCLCLNRILTCLVTTMSPKACLLFIERLIYTLNAICSYLRIFVSITICFANSFCLINN